MNIKSYLAIAAIVIGGGIAAAPASRSSAPAAHDAAGVAPNDFTHPKANRYFPLKPGAVTRLRGSDEDGHYLERVTVTHHTKLIQGVRTRVIRDVVHRRDGSLSEKTRDWYASDNDGTVWYFGEATATYDRAGDLESRDGTWQAGRSGAVAGRIMPAQPHPTQAYRQEFQPKVAEDQAWIVQRGASTTVPYGRLDHLVRSFEWSRLEKGVLSLKFYAPGIGIVQERDMSGGHEEFVLVSMKKG
jgi:hypothetical protein